MTTARNQRFCEKHDTNIGCYCGFGVCPGNITERIIALFMYKNHFSIIWESRGVSFNKSIGELK